MAARVLEVHNLTVDISSTEPPLRVLNGVSFSLEKGETIGLVGESGSGKTMTAKSILGLLPPNCRIVGGDILLNGESLRAKGPREMQQIRGRRLCLIPQDAGTALDPVIRIGTQITETLQSEDGYSSGAATERALELLRLFRIPDEREKFMSYPHQLSGGMRQRVLSAIAMSRSPDVIVADEPTTALDATLQLQYLRLLKSVQEQTGVSIVFITHDFGIVRRMCDRVVVMYAGRSVESAATSDLLSTPLHPYSRGLIDAVPDPGQRVDYFSTIAGEPPPLDRLPPGCSFEPRCPLRIERCRVEFPPVTAWEGERTVRCWRAGDSAHG